MSHVHQIPFAAAFIIGVAIASVVIGASIVLFASPESIRFASLPNATLPPTATPQSTQTLTQPATATNTRTPTATLTNTASASPTVTASRTASATPTAPPTETATVTHTPIPTHTSTLTPTPSKTPVPTATTLPLNLDQAEFVADVTVPDGTDFKAGASFTKTWRIRNVGTSTWTTDYIFEFAGGAKLAQTQSVPLPTSVAPGEVVDISVEMVAPSNPGNKVSLFQFRNASGQPFGVGPRYNDFIYVQINVVK